MSRSLNRVTLLGNLTADPETRNTASGSNFVTFTVATNREWKEHSGEKKQETEFHRIIAWDRLGELCASLLNKGSKTMLEGRLTTRTYTDKNNTERQITEIVISDMIALDGKRPEPYNPS